MRVEKYLHIISFDNPFPPIYGGTIDVFYKIKALHSLGYQIFLHCFIDEFPKDIEVLNSLTQHVYFYKRKRKGLRFFSKAPFSVSSRQHPDLINNLKGDNFPILFEGLQSTFLVNYANFSERKIFLRLMNIESNYYNGLSKSERDPIKKLLYSIESLKYKRYEKIISKFTAVFTLSLSETGYVDKKFSNAHYIPVFHGNEKVANLSEFGKYALYHGDLRLADNRRAASYLIELFKKIPDYDLIIASNHAKQFIENQIQNHRNITHVAIADQEHLNHLLSDAHISVMLSFQESGTKLKAVNSLFKSRFCLINNNMIDDPRVRNLVSIAETKTEFTQTIQKLRMQKYSDYSTKCLILDEVLNDNKNAKKLMNVIESFL